MTFNSKSQAAITFGCPKRHPDLGGTFATTVSEWLQRGQANVRCSQLGFFVGLMPSTNIGQPHLVHRGRPIGADEA
jgi:hypothetical protein